MDRRKQITKANEKKRAINASIVNGILHNKLKNIEDSKHNAFGISTSTMFLTSSFTWLIDARFWVETYHLSFIDFTILQESVNNTLLNLTTRVFKPFVSYVPIVLCGLYVMHLGFHLCIEFS